MICFEFLFWNKILLKSICLWSFGSFINSEISEIMLNDEMEPAGVDVDHTVINVIITEQTCSELQLLFSIFQRYLCCNNKAAHYSTSYLQKL